MSETTAGPEKPEKPEKPLGWSDRIKASVEAQREGFTMTLYMSIVTLSVLLVDENSESKAQDIRLIIGSAVGILLAHLLAFRLSASFFAVSAEDPDERDHRLLEMDVSSWALIRATAVVVVLAILPYFLLPVEWAGLVSAVVLALIIGGSAHAVGRAYGSPNSKALTYGLIVTAMAIGIAIIKIILTH